MDKEYWLCCGSTEFFKHMDGCCEAQIGHPEHCRWGTADQHSLWQIKSTPQTKPLSDEEIWELHQEHIDEIPCGHSMKTIGFVEFARAIEERHGIK